jgi:hypothetical protein
MDLTDTIEPKSDQVNADDLLTGPRTFTIADVSKGSPEQPVNITLEEFPKDRPYKPSKSMRRVLVAAWGPEASKYVGRRLTLYRDAEITFGPDKVGGIRISHLSHISKRLTLALTVKRGKRTPYVVEPLPETAPTVVAVSAETLAELDALFTEAGITEEQRLPGVNSIINGSATGLETLTEQQAQTVLAALNQRIGR